MLRPQLMLIERDLPSLLSIVVPTVREVLGAIEAVTGRRVPTVDGARRIGDPAGLVASAQRAEQVLGWRARRSDIQTIVEDAWRWHARLRAA